MEPEGRNCDSVCEWTVNHNYFAVGFTRQNYRSTPSSPPVPPELA